MTDANPPPVVRASRPRLLFLCQTLPYPPDGGVAIRSFNILRLLAQEYDVTALCFYRRAVAKDVAASVRALGTYARTEAFPIPQEHSRTRFLVDHATSLLRARVYTVAAYDSDAFRARVREEKYSGNYDIVHLDSLDLSGLIDELAGLPVVCTHHNVESSLLTRRAGVERRLLYSWYLRLQGRLMLREEKMWCPRVALNVTVSSNDEQELSTRAPGINTVVVPNGVDTTAFQPTQSAGQGAVFVGGMSWFPNSDALDYFSHVILPLARRNGDFPVTWVGRASPGAAERYAKLGVSLTGYVEDIRPFVNEAACYVVPLRVGGGTRLKILDAWALGKAVVSTSVGCEGLEARDGWNILIRDNPADFAQAMQDLLMDVPMRRELERNARRTAEETYSWVRIGGQMLPRYRALAMNQ